MYGHCIGTVIGESCCGYVGKVHVEYVDGIVYHREKKDVKVVQNSKTFIELLIPCDVVGAAQKFESHDKCED